MLRSILAVIAGYAVVVVGTIVVMAVLAAMAPAAFPQDNSPTAAPPSVWALVAMLSGGGASMVLGGFVAARIGRGRPMAHALVLGGLMFVLAVIALIMSMQQPVPMWYRVGGVLMSVPLAALGGWLAIRRSSVSLGTEAA